MFRADYLSSLDDLAGVFAVRSAVPELSMAGRDAHDAAAVYVLVCDESNVPFGCGRLYVDAGGSVWIDAVGVLPAYRRQFIGDLIVGMLLSRARALDAPAILARVPLSLLPYFSRYGFEAGAPCENVCGEPARVMRILSDRIRLESACAHDEIPMCTGDCAHCQRRH